MEPKRASGGAWQRWVLAALALCLFLPGLGSHDLWNPDEPRYAEVAREMRITGEYLVPKLNGEIYSEKPPLHFWIISLTSRLLGDLDETSVRLGSVLAATATVLLTFSLGELLFGRFTAWLAAAILATSIRFLWQARCGQIDMLLTFLVTLGVYFWAQGFFADRRRLYPLFFVATGAATLAKGPAGFLPPLLAILAFLAFTGRRQQLKDLRVGRGLLLWVAVVMVWLVPAAIAGGWAYLYDILYMQNVHRFVTPGASRRMSGHLRPWYYYLIVLLADFFPWSLLLPTSLWIAWRRTRHQQRAAVHFLLAWFLVTLVFFSLSPAKRSVYIFPMYPALALLTAGGLEIWRRLWPRYRLAVASAPVVAALVLTAIAAAVLLVAPTQPQLDPLDDRLFALVPAFLTLAILGAAAGGWWSWRGQPGVAATAQALGMAAMALAVSLHVLPRFDIIKSPRYLAGQLTRRLSAEQSYGMYPRLEPGILFYSRRLTALLETEDELHDFIQTTSNPLIVVRARDLRELQRPVELTELACDSATRDGWCLLGPREQRSG